MGWRTSRTPASWLSTLKRRLLGTSPTYDGVGGGRRAVAWQVGNPGAVAALAFTQNELRAKSRDLARRNAWAAAGIEAFVANAIGTGIKPQSMVQEPAVHVTYDEAQAFCRWAGGRLPNDAQWTRAAYAETRAQPPAPFVRGTVYPYPTGERPEGAQCLGDCGPQAEARALRHGATLLRGHGHARVDRTPAGVNGLHDMGGNVWEWVDEPEGASGAAQRLTRGGSWWYGAAQMRADHRQSKPGDTTVVYIGFRCVKTP